MRANSIRETCAPAGVGALAGVALAAAGFGWLADTAGVPAGYLFGSILVGLAVALAAAGRVAMPHSAFRVGQAVAGVALGTFLQSSALSGLGWRWVPVVLVGLATLAVTIVAGLVLAKVTDLDRPTASLGMIAGGASGIVGIAGDLGGDDRLVAFMQYLRVLVVTLLTPLAAPLVFGAHSGGAVVGEGPLLGSPEDWALTAGAAALGVFLGPLLRLPAPMLLGPLLLTAALSLSGVIGDADVPPLAREVAFGLIGLWIGLEFDGATLRRIREIAVPVAVAIAALLLACFVLAYVLKIAAGVSLLDAYLATTPGGLYAVLPIAYAAGGNTTFVLAVQGLRLLAMIVAAPIIVRWLVRSEGAKGAVV